MTDALCSGLGPCAPVVDQALASVVETMLGGLRQWGAPGAAERYVSALRRLLEDAAERQSRVSQGTAAALGNITGTGEPVVLTLKIRSGSSPPPAPGKPCT